MLSVHQDSSIVIPAETCDRSSIYTNRAVAVVPPKKTQHISDPSAGLRPTYAPSACFCSLTRLQCGLDLPEGVAHRRPGHPSGCTPPGDHQRQQCRREHPSDHAGAQWLAGLRSSPQADSNRDHAGKSTHYLMSPWNKMFIICTCRSSGCWRRPLIRSVKMMPYSKSAM